MHLWIILLITNLIVPVTMILFGKLFMENPPKDINSVYGYRTRLSMKNQDTWDFAHRYNGKVWFFTGLVVLPATILVMLLLLWSNDAVIGTVGLLICTVQLVILLGTIPVIEKALRKNFDEDGNRKA